MNDEDEQRTPALRQASTVVGLISVPSGSLPDELIRRLSVYDPSSSNEVPSTSGRLSVRLFCQVRRSEAWAGSSASAHTWRPSVAHGPGISGHHACGKAMQMIGGSSPGAWCCWWLGFPEWRKLARLTTTAPVSRLACCTHAFRSATMRGMGQLRVICAVQGAA